MTYEEMSKEELIMRLTKCGQRLLDTNLDDMQRELSRHKDRAYSERRRHKETEKRLLNQVRFLLLENNQLHKELDEIREREDLWITHQLSTQR